MKSHTLLAAAPALLLAACATTSTPAPDAAAGPPPGYELVWSDEFDGDGLPDPAKWGYDLRGNDFGWWNEEKQFYTEARAQNARIEDGILIIEARREHLPEGEQPGYKGQDYTSARLITRGKAAWQYGYFEVRAKLPCGRGTWPAIWTLADGEGTTWPDDGEIDIMEHVGWEEGVVHATVHTRDYNHRIGNQSTSTIMVEDVCGAFHDYTLLWTPEAITVGVDDTAYYTYRKTDEGYGAWPFDRPHYLLLNVAVGGWGGVEGIDDAIFPVRMEVDHVRIWQKRWQQGR